MDEQQGTQVTPGKRDGHKSRHAIAAAGFTEMLVMVGLFTSVPSSRNPIVVLFNPIDLMLAGCAIAFGLLSAINRERLWPLGVISAAVSATPFVLQLFPAFRS